MRPAPLEPIESALARSPQRRDVVGQKHEPERQHPEAENRQDGQASADDQQHAGRDARPARGGLSEPAGCGLHAPRQPAEEPPEPPLMIDADDIVGKGQVSRAQAPEIGAGAGEPQSGAIPIPRRRRLWPDALDRLGRRVEGVDDRLDLLRAGGAAAQAKLKGGSGD